MSQPRSPFDLMLAYPQWQGSGRPANLVRGAKMTADICAGFADRVDVPTSDAPDDGRGPNRWPAILEQFVSAQALLCHHEPRRILTAGGDCAVDVAVIDYLNRIHDGLVIIWIDAHLDANSPATSPSGNFHGMPVAALMGESPDDLKVHLGKPIDPRRFFYVNGRAADRGDLAFQRRMGLQMLDLDALTDRPVHIHFDLDVFDPTVFPHVGYGEPDGLAIIDGIDLVRGLCACNDLVGLTITEFAPADADAAREGGRIIAQLCDAALGR